MNVRFLTIHFVLVFTLSFSSGHLFAYDTMDTGEATSRTTFLKKHKWKCIIIGTVAVLSVLLLVAKLSGKNSDNASAKKQATWDPTLPKVNFYGQAHFISEVHDSMGEVLVRLSSFAGAKELPPTSEILSSLQSADAELSAEEVKNYSRNYESFMQVVDSQHKIVESISKKVRELPAGKKLTLMIEGVNYDKGELTGEMSSYMANEVNGVLAKIKKGEALTNAEKFTLMSVGSGYILKGLYPDKITLFGAEGASFSLRENLGVSKSWNDFRASIQAGLKHPELADFIKSYLDSKAEDIQDNKQYPSWNEDRELLIEGLIFKPREKDVLSNLRKVQKNIKELTSVDLIYGAAHRFSDEPEIAVRGSVRTAVEPTNIIRQKAGLEEKP